MQDLWMIFACGDGLLHPQDGGKEQIVGHFGQARLPEASTQVAMQTHLLQEPGLPGMSTYLPMALKCLCAIETLPDAAW